MGTLWILAGAIGGFAAVAIGAAASHLGTDAHAVELMQTAAQYAMYHALALLAVGLLTRPERRLAAWILRLAGTGFLAGLVLFSGGLVALALTGSHAFARAVPFGGAAFLLGWAALALAAVLDRRG